MCVCVGGWCKATKKMGEEGGEVYMEGSDPGSSVGAPGVESRPAGVFSSGLQDKGTPAKVSKGKKKCESGIG